MNIEIEPMMWGHVDEVLGIEQASFGADAWSADAFWSELSAVPHAKHYIVALADDVVVGYAGLQFINPESEILTVAVQSEQRRHGIARMLINELEAVAQQHACTTVHLEVEDSNEAARTMYAHLGYHEVGLRRGYYGPGRDAILMSRELPTTTAAASGGD
ncbi:MAG: ribosomal-protein-alanine N-acetyltransferase, partial [Actinobacteria bacterium]|nr:ribosomal-protein-alanine N-acetyltransferase [Actinomycetota bacterium]